MDQPSGFVGNVYEASIASPGDLLPIAHALSNGLRLDILKMVGKNSLNLNELSRALNVPLSTVALNVKVLEGAGLVFTEMQPGARGKMKMCVQRIHKVTLNLVDSQSARTPYEQIEIPVGRYALAGDIRPTCGYADFERAEDSDDPYVFYHPDHFGAEILWMREGYLEYHAPVKTRPDAAIEYVEVSFEACSEYAGHRNNWPSDIYVEINGQRLGVWQCPGDFGGRRGLLNPDWWADTSTQYGHLKTWRVNGQGSWLDGNFLSGVAVDALRLPDAPYARIRVGVQKNAGHAGGMNLFGKRFGDFAQGILFRVGYHAKKPNA